jgi:segregation and condensation protein A
MPEIRLPVFQGPLDLLLHLIERDDLDITAVSLVSVTDQYLKAVHRGGELDAQALAEFVALGAKLIYLKSRALLPPDPTVENATLEDDDVGRELVELLREYKRFGEITDMLSQRQDDGVRYFPRTAPSPVVPPGLGLNNVTVDLLNTIMREVLSRTPEEVPAQVIPRQTISLAQQIENFRHSLRTAGSFSFREAISAYRVRIEIVIAFMAILELLKAGECDARQAEGWGDIQVVAIRARAGSRGG